MAMDDNGIVAVQEGHACHHVRQHGQERVLLKVELGRVQHLVQGLVLQVLHHQHGLGWRVDNAKDRHHVRMSKVPAGKLKHQTTLGAS